MMVEGREDAGGRLRAKNHAISVEIPRSPAPVVVRERTPLGTQTVIEVLRPRLSSWSKAVTHKGRTIKCQTIPTADRYL
jgi:hypothetical protein